MKKIEELSGKLREAEASMTADTNRLFFPNGRGEAWDRINGMCELSPAALGNGPIDRSPNPFWKTRR